MTALVFAGCGALTLWGLVRRPQAIMVTLALAFLASVAAADLFTHEALRPVLIAIDGMVVAAMAALWVQHHSQRARLVGAISFLNCSLGVACMGIPETVWNTYAGWLNGAFVAQVLIAGGFAHGLVNRGWRVRAGGSVNGGTA